MSVRERERETDVKERHRNPKQKEVSCKEDYHKGNTRAATYHDGVFEASEEARSRSAQVRKEKSMVGPKRSQRNLYGQLK